MLSKRQMIVCSRCSMRCTNMPLLPARSILCYFQGSNLGYIPTHDMSMRSRMLMPSDRCHTRHLEIYKRMQFHKKSSPTRTLCLCRLQRLKDTRIWISRSNQGLEALILALETGMQSRAQDIAAIRADMDHIHQTLRCVAKGTVCLVHAPCNHRSMCVLTSAFRACMVVQGPLSSSWVVSV